MATLPRVNDDWIIHGVFSVRATGALTDPTTVTLKVRTPSGVATSYTYGAASVSKVSTGHFYKQITLSEAGMWAYQWEGAGAVAKVEAGTIEVLGSDYGL